MASAMHTAGEERLDMLMKMIPVSYPGSDLVVKALSSLTAVLLSEPQNCERVGVSDVVRYKLEEIRSVRQSSDDIDNVDVGIMFDFYYDVMRCYADAERSRLTEDRFKRMKSFLPAATVRGVIDGEFSKLHSALATLGFSYFPPSWTHVEYIQIRDMTKSDSTKMQNYCYLHLFKSSYSNLVASILGPRPTLGAVLSLLSPRASESSGRLDPLYVIREDNNDLHITRKIPTGAHLLVDDILTYQDDEDHRDFGLISIFDRVGAATCSESHDAMFEQALNCLNDIVKGCEDAEDKGSGSYRLADVDFEQDVISSDFPQGAASLRLIYNEGYLPSFLRTWKPNVRAKALVIALKEYDAMLLNLHVASIGLSQLREQGKLHHCNTRWRSDVSNVIGISKLDADYWGEMSDEIATGFRTIYSSPVPIWLQREFERKVEEFVNDALTSYVKPTVRPATSFNSEAFVAEFGRKHSRRVSASSSGSTSSGSSDGARSMKPCTNLGAFDKLNPRKTKPKLSPEGLVRYNQLMSCPDRKIPGFITSLPAVHLFRLAGDECYTKYKSKYVRNLVLKECKI